MASRRLDPDWRILWLPWNRRVAPWIVPVASRPAFPANFQVTYSDLKGWLANRRDPIAQNPMTERVPMVQENLLGIRQMGSRIDYLNFVYFRHWIGPVD